MLLSEVLKDLEKLLKKQGDGEVRADEFRTYSSVSQFIKPDHAAKNDLIYIIGRYHK